VKIGTSSIFEDFLIFLVFAMVPLSVKISNARVLLMHLGVWEGWDMELYFVRSGSARLKWEGRGYCELELDSIVCM
jgi:hypothetical protein